LIQSHAAERRADLTKKIEKRELEAGEDEDSDARGSAEPVSGKRGWACHENIRS